MQTLVPIRKQPVKGLAGYGFALTCVLIALLLRLLLDDRVGDAIPLMIFFIAIVFIVHHTSRGPSVFAIILSAVAGEWFFISPRHDFTIVGMEAWLTIAFFIIATSAVLCLSERARGSLKRESEAAEEASALNRRMQTLLAALPVGVCFSDDASCRRIFGNAALRAQFELTAEDNLSAWAPEKGATGPNISFFTDGKPLGPSNLPLQRAVQENRLVGPYEMEILLPSGKRWHAEAVGAPLHDENGVVVAGVAVIQDITARKRAEQTLMENKEELRRVLQRLHFHIENTPLAVVEFDPDLRLSYWSRGASEMFGWHSDEVLGKSMWDLPWLPAEDQAKVQQVAESMFKGASLRSISSNRNIRKDGSILFCEWYNSSLVDEHGKMQSVLSLVLDVTEKVKAEAALRESEHRFQVMADNTPVLIWVHGPNEELQFVNKGYLEFFGMKPEQLRNLDWVSLTHPDESAYVENFRRCIRERRSFKAQGRAKRSDGEWRWLESSGEPRFSSTGEYLGIAGCSVDVTEKTDFLSELERQVDERTRQLTEATEQLNAFCYSIAHDLRAPVRAQKAFGTLLIDEFGAALGPTGTDYARRIVESAERQGKLVSDLVIHLGVSRTNLPLSSVDLSECVTVACSELAEDVKRTGAIVEFDTAGGRVLANADSLHLVLINLLSNSLKFVARGVRPHVKMWTEAHPSSIRLFVKDNGIGIDPAYNEKVFGVFQRLHQGPEYPGTGIGLAIVKRSVERMNGTTGFESRPGEGSCFWFELPRCRHDQGS